MKKVAGQSGNVAPPFLAVSMPQVARTWPLTAFNTRMSAREAIDTLATVGAVAPQPQGRKSLDARMRESEQARLGPDGDKPATGKMRW